MSTPEPQVEVQAESAAALPAGLAWRRRLWRWLQRLALLVLLLCAAWVGCGRLAMPLLVAQKDKVEVRLGQLLGTRVDIAVLEGSWQGLSPGFAVEGLVLQLDPDDPGTRFAIDGGELSLDLWASLWQGRPALNRLTFSGLELSLQQNANGRWSLRGLPPGDRDYKDLILDLLLKTPDIRVQEARVRMTLANGYELPLRSVYLQLENEGSRHELSLQFRLGDSGPPQLAVLQLQGDPRASFLGSGWLAFDALDLQAPLAALLPEDWQLDELQLQGDLWFDLDPAGLRALQARVDDLRLQGKLGPLGETRISNTVLELGAWPEPGTRAAAPVWRFTLQDLVLEYNDILLAPGRLNLRLPLEPAQAWSLQAERLDVATLAALAASLPLPEAVSSALTTLAPRGQLGPLHLEADRSGNYPEGFLLRSGFQDLALEAWRSAPAASGLQGYLEATARQGLVEVDSHDFSLHLPRLFARPWHYERVNTRVRWALAPGEVTVSSQPITVSSEQLEGRVSFSLHNSGLGSEDYRSDFSLLVGMERMDVALHGDYLPTLPGLADTMRWLDEGLQGGRIVDSGFMLRVSGGQRAGLDSLTHSSWYRVEDAELRFLPDWPPVQVASAGIFVSDRHIDVLSQAATIAGIEASQVVASVRPRPGGGSQLRLDVEAVTDTATGLDFLRDTPVRQQVGAALDAWEGSGQLQLQLLLQQALGGAPEPQVLEVAVQPLDAGLFIAPYQLEFSSLEGALRYSHSAGLQAEELQARLFGSPVTVDIDTEAPRDAVARRFVIAARGLAEPEALAAWEGQSSFVRNILGHAEGNIPYRARVELSVGSAASTQRPRLLLQSDLDGVAIALPQPFAKTAAERRDLQLELTFHPERRDLTLRHADWLSGQLSLENGGLPQGQLHFGRLNRDFTIRQNSPSEPGLLISGELDAFDYDAWSAVAAGFSSGSGAEGGGLQDYLRLVNVSIGQLQIRGQEFENIALEVQPLDEAWLIHGSNERLAGNLRIPLAGKEPWQVELDYLRFPPRPAPDPEASAPPEEVDLLEHIDPRSLPAFVFSTRELSIGPSDLGSWSLELEPTADGALIHNLRMQEAASRIHGKDSAEEGAEISWLYRNGVHQSRFEGMFAAGDLARVMPKWGHNANIVSRQASFGSQLYWPGSPLAFSLKKASGDVDLSITTGRFVDIESGSSRLLGAFNFDSLLRRVELDFSDLYQRGFAFDTIRGKLGFRDGVVNFTSPLVIDGPSSRITIEGEINLPRETIAADMLVRIPLGENISMLAGLLGAWPIALSTYLASKIFAAQVEDFTTIVYRLDGPWSNPQAGFEPPEEELEATVP
jgi:uncharacterized protein (TIGR02099 family)